MVKHSKELEAAIAILEYYNMKGKTMDVTKLFAFSNCSLLVQSSEDIPQGSYKEQQDAEGKGTVSTYVPFRNGLFLSAAASLALSLDCGYIYYGAHSDDAAGNAYPDCTEQFYKSMGDAIFEGSGKECSLEAPFINANKADIVKEGLRLNVPYHLTWSCYEGGDKPCGHCGTCIDRAKAFHANGVEDPAL
jgi:7-cyano-7-deazaguanine synthase